MTTREIEQRVREWAESHHISDYDMGAVLAQIPQDATEDEIYHAVTNHACSEISDRDEFRTYLRMFGITDSDVADTVMAAATYEYNGRMVHTPSSLTAAINEHWYKR